MRRLANLQTKVCSKPGFDREAAWHLRGIHDAEFQVAIAPALKQELWARDHAWQLKQESRAKRKAAKKEAKAQRKRRALDLPSAAPSSE